MKYEVANDKILIYDKEDFNAKHILECGQIFRYKKLENGHYVLLSQDKKAEVFEHDFGYEIITKDTLYFENFFDLKTDYSKIKKVLSKQNKTLELASQFGNGIRILNQPPHEMIFSFIISGNQNENDLP